MEAQEKKKIYIVLSQTGTIVSKMIRIVTRKKYSHASISLTPDLQLMYSFGRLHPYAVLPAGFVREAPDISTFKRFRNKADVIILEIEVTDQELEGVKSKISEMLEEQEKYHYNYIGLFKAAVNLTHPKRDYKYYCSEFVTEVLEENNLIDRSLLPDIVHPMNFLDMPWKVIYQGKIREYEPNISEY